MVDSIGTRTLNDLLDERAALDGGRLAITVEDASGHATRLTYGELRKEVMRTAGGCQRLGLGHGDAVLVSLGNSVEFVVMWFALARIGAVLVPLNPALTSREVAYAARKVGARAVVARSGDLEVIGAAAGLARDRWVSVGDPVAGTLGWAELSSGSEPVELPSVADVDVVEIIFTSGTTAEPKGVLITHANCLRSGEQVARSLWLTPEDTALSALPAFHVNAQSSTILPALTVGARCVLLEQYSASRYIGQLRQHGATVTSLVATQVRTLLRQPPTQADDDHAVKRVFYAINVTDGEYEEFERRFGMRLLNGYGLSEAMTAVTIAPMYGDRGWPSVGLPLVDRLVRIVDSEGREVPTGEIGEILVGGVPGRSLMRGYHEDPEATEKALRNGWLHTGDFGFLNERGYLHFVDRKKDMIKRAGENISASEIESVLLEHPGVTEAAVLGMPDDVRDELVLAVVAGSDLTVDGVLEHCRERLAPYKVPSRIEIRTGLPRTSIGKIEKKQLRTELLAAEGSHV